MIRAVFRPIALVWLVLFLTQPHQLIAGTVSPSSEDWVGLWILEGASYPEFSNFNCCDNYLLISPDLFIIGAASWGEQRWGNVSGQIKPKRNMASLDNGPCSIELKMDDKNLILATDNMACGGVNVRFQGKYLKHKPLITKSMLPRWLLRSVDNQSLQRQAR